MASGYSNYNFTFDHPRAYPGSGAGPSSYSNSNGAPGPSTLPPPAQYNIQRPFMPSAREDSGVHRQPQPLLTGDPAFDILDWHPAYQSCQRYFLDYAQHEQATQALCALINIRLPFQYGQNPIVSSSGSAPAPTSGGAAPNYAFPFPRHSGTTASLSPDNRRNGSANYQHPSTPAFVSLIPYIRRLVITGFDRPAILHGFFGDDYNRGVLPHLDCERRNYLFAAKAGGWGQCKSQYDTGSGMGGDEAVPFMKPLEQAKMEELTNAEKSWSGWLAMEDWMVGPRAPEDSEDNQTVRGGAGSAVNTTEVGGMPDGLPQAFAGE